MAATSTKSDAVDRLCGVVEALLQRDLSILERFGQVIQQAFNNGYAMGRQHGITESMRPLPPGTEDAFLAADEAVDNMLPPEPDEPVLVGHNGIARPPDAR